MFGTGRLGGTVQRLLLNGHDTALPGPRQPLLAGQVASTLREANGFMVYKYRF